MITSKIMCGDVVQPNTKRIREITSICDSNNFLFDIKEEEVELQADNYTYDAYVMYVYIGEEQIEIPFTSMVSLNEKISHLNNLNFKFSVSTTLDDNSQIKGTITITGTKK